MVADGRSGDLNLRGHSQPRARWRIASRLMLLTGLLAAALTGIVLLVVAAFSRVQTLTSEVVNEQVAQVVESSRIGRELSSVFSAINLLSRTFYERDDLLERDGDALLESLQSLAERSDNPELREHIEALADSLADYLQQCRRLNAITRERARVDAASNAEVDALEQVISRRMIRYTMEGLDTYYVDQLLNLTTGYRESLLRISKRYAENYSAHARARVQDDTQSGSLLAQIDDLLLRLQTITASSPDVAVHGEQLYELVGEYRTKVGQLETAFVDLDVRLERLEAAKSRTLGALALIDRQTSERSALAVDEIGHIVERAGRLVASAALLVLVVLGGFMLVFMRRHIKRPLEEILAGIGELQQGHYGTRLALHRADEWSTIERGLNDMAAEIANSWSALKDSEQRYRLLVENQGDMIVKLDPQNRFQFVSPAYCETFGKSEEELLGKTFMPLVHADDRRMTERAIASLGQPPHTCSYEQRALGRTGWRWLAWTNRAVLDEEGCVSAVVAVGRDITERKQAEVALEAQHQFLRTVIDAVPDPLLVINRDFNVEMANRAAHREFSAAAENFDWYGGRGCAGCQEWLAHGKSEQCGTPQHECAVRNVVRSGRQMRQIQHRHLKSGDDAEQIFEISSNPYRDEGGQIAGIVQVCRDITEQRQAEQRVHFLAHHDPLTRLPNRLLAEDRFEQAARHSEREDGKVALLFLDLDHFKNINDTLGHHVGDRLLQGVVERLHDQVRESDTISRQGGDEFLIVMPIDDLSAVERVARNILVALSEEVRIDDYALHTSFSIGISVYPDDGREFAILLQKADTAMYSAKGAGRNAYRYYAEEMNLDALEHLQLHGQFRNAFERGELSLVYQPQVDLASGALTGTEALLRWHSPELGWVSPVEFVPMAEETGMIEPIGAWVLQEACCQARRWGSENGLPVPVSVNLSAVQFRRGNLLEQVGRALEVSGLAPELLELELTESTLLRDTDAVLATVCELKSLGVRLAIDDFGTGYSSLSYLKRFPVDRLKIDRSFIVQMHDDPDYAGIVRAIIQMAASLNLEVVAEGVDSREQCDWLLAEGCCQAQGFYFSRPVCSERITSFLDGRRGALG